MKTRTGGWLGNAAVVLLLCIIAAGTTFAVVPQDWTVSEVDADEQWADAQEAPNLAEQLAELFNRSPTIESYTKALQDVPELREMSELVLESTLRQLAPLLCARYPERLSDLQRLLPVSAACPIPEAGIVPAARAQGDLLHELERVFDNGMPPATIDMMERVLQEVGALVAPRSAPTFSEVSRRSGLDGNLNARLARIGRYLRELIELLKRNRARVVAFITAKLAGLPRTPSAVSRLGRSSWQAVQVHVRAARDAGVGFGNRVATRVRDQVLIPVLHAIASIWAFFTAPRRVDFEYLVMFSILAYFILAGPMHPRQPQRPRPPQRPRQPRH